MIGLAVPQFVAGEGAGGDVVDVGLERRLEAVFPAEDRRQHRMFCVERVCLAGAERVGVLAEVDKLRDLAFANDQLRVVLDLFVIIRPAVRERVARIIRHSMISISSFLMKSMRPIAFLLRSNDEMTK